MDTEAARIISVVVAVIGLLVAWGLVSQAHADALIAAATALLPFVLALIQGAITRQAVFSKATVQKIADAATQLPPGTPVDIGSPPSGAVAPPAAPPASG